jgi:hypothetical protein
MSRDLGRGEVTITRNRARVDAQKFKRESAQYRWSRGGEVDPDAATGANGQVETRL